jgi:hypothetical protein
VLELDIPKAQIVFALNRTTETLGRTEAPEEVQCRNAKKGVLAQLIYVLWAPQMNGARSKTRYTRVSAGGERLQTLIKTHKKNVRRFAGVCSGFASTTFHCFPY